MTGAPSMLFAVRTDIDVYHTAHLQVLFIKDSINNRLHLYIFAFIIREESELVFGLFPSPVYLLLVVCCQFLQIFVPFKILVFQLSSLLSRYLPHFVHRLNYPLLLPTLTCLQLLFLSKQLFVLSLQLLNLFLHHTQLLSVFLTLLVYDLCNHSFVLLQLVILLFQKRNKTVVILRFLNKYLSLLLKLRLHFL